MSKHRFIKQGLAVAALLTLISLEVFVVWFFCMQDGFMTPREFCIGVITAVSFNLLIAFFLRSVLPFRLWQITVWTVCGMWLAWYNPAPERLHYWMTIKRLHIGMTVSEVQKIVQPYILQRQKSQSRPGAMLTNRMEWYVSGHQPSSPHYDAAYITTQNDTVTDIRRGFDD